MELCCTARPISNLPHSRPFTPTHTRLLQFHCNSPASRISVSSNFNPSGLRYYADSSLRTSFSDEISSGASLYAKDGPDGVITLEETRTVEEKIEYEETFPKEPPKEVPPEENQTLQLEFLEKLDIKFDSDNTYSILLLGGGALVALYLINALVGAIDRIPLVPTLLEIVGLSYTVWFSTRYLLFKENREEFFTKIEYIKQEVFGSDDD